MSLPVVVEKGGSVSQPDAAAHFSFPRTDRLTARRQFRAVYDQGRRVRERSMTVFGLPNRLGRCRVGFTVTRKLGNAVMRNRVKRTLREIYRLRRFSEVGSMDLVVNAHASILEYPRAEVERDFEQCVTRLTGGASR